jgi:hypothetical protein
VGGTAVNAEWYRGEYILKIFVSFMQWFLAVCVKELFVFLQQKFTTAERLKGEF